MCKQKEVILDLPDSIATHKQNRTVGVDACIAEVIRHLWSKGIETLGCCCGHGREDPSLIVADGYGLISIGRIQKQIAEIDHRRWIILQWKLTKVNGIDPDQRFGEPFCAPPRDEAANE